MRLNEVIELSWYRILKIFISLECSAQIWGFYAFRKFLLYGTCVYLVRSIFGTRRRHFGDNPLRILKNGVWPWFPSTVKKEKIRALRFFRNKFARTAISDVKYLHENNPTPKFYADTEKRIPLHPLPEEEPLIPIAGINYPPGYFLLQRTLNQLTHFSAKDSANVWKVSQIRSLKKDEALFTLGDVDHSFHLVLSGSIAISFEDEELGHTKTKTVYPNERIISVMRIMDMFFDEELWAKSVNAVAQEDSIVMEVPYSSLKLSYQDNSVEIFPFLIRTLGKIRRVYFEGFEELAGIGSHLIQPKYRYPVARKEEPDMNSVESYITEAKEKLSKHFNLNSEDWKQCSVGLIEGETIVTRIARKQKSLIFIIKGELQVGNESKREILIKKKNGSKSYGKMEREFVPVAYLHEGEFLGAWSILTGCRNQYSSRVANGQRVILAELPGKFLEKLWLRDPMNMISLAKTLIRRFNYLCRQIDYCVDWKSFSPGGVVYRKGDPKVATFLVVSGRLRYRVHGSYLVLKKLELENSSRFGHYLPGVWFGFVESIVTAPTMQKTVIADRHAEIAIFPQQLMVHLYFRFNQMLTFMTSYLAYRIHKDYNYELIGSFYPRAPIENAISYPKYCLKKNSPTFMLVVFPLNDNIPGDFYCRELARHYPKICKIYNHENFMAFIKHQPQKENRTEIKRWLNNILHKPEPIDLVIVLGNLNEVDLFNTMLARITDFIHFVGTTNSDCSIIPHFSEKKIAQEGWKASKEMIFLHPAEVRKVDKSYYKDGNTFIHQLSCRLPNGTYRWLNRRPWLDTHHNVRFPSCIFGYINRNDTEYLEEFEKYIQLVGVNQYSDLARVGRRLSNSMVGLVLGGGGAKGATHIGVLEYIQELDFPIDYICGVSIGSFVGGLLSYHDHDLKNVEISLIKLLRELGQPSKYLSDLTIPFSSMFRGRCFDEFVRNSFGDTFMEDLWTPYFCVTTDISGNHSKAHKHGNMWYYIRASMTLTMIFPPQLNPGDKHLIMDGGYSEILPGNHLRRCGVRYLLAIDITDENGIPTFNIGYECSGFKCVIQNFMMTTLGWPRIPSQMSFWEQLNYISATKYIDILKKMDRRVVYVRPIIEFYNGKDFHKVHEMRMMGYYITRRRFSGIHPGLDIETLWSIFILYHPKRRRVDYNHGKNQASIEINTGKWEKSWTKSTR